MSITVWIKPESGTVEQYFEVIRRLEEAGAGAPAGRLYHVTFGGDGALGTVDVWSSREEFDEFAKVLMPIVQGVGIELAPPQFFETLNVID
jgi:hypothetical protein